MKSYNSQERRDNNYAYPTNFCSNSSGLQYYNNFNSYNSNNQPTAYGGDPYYSKSGVAYNESIPTGIPPQRFDNKNRQGKEHYTSVSNNPKHPHIWGNRYDRPYYYNNYQNNEVETYLIEHINHQKKNLNLNLEKLMNSEILVYDEYDKLCKSSNTERFLDLGFDATLMENIANMQFDKMTPIQRAVISYIFEGSDLMGCAQTGSGKTIAFLLPIFEKMMKGGPPKVIMTPKSSYPVTLILAPTRELADQIYKVAKLLAINTGISVGKVYGGVPHDSQIRDLKSGVDILISTTGRLLDFLSNKLVSLSCIKHLIIDEADRLLEMGFEKQLNEILHEHDMPEKKDRQTLMFSATFSKEIRKTVQAALNTSYLLAASNIEDYAANDNIEQNFIYVEEHEKISQLHFILQQCQGTAIIFLDRKKAVDDLHYKMLKGNYNCAVIHGDKSQFERTSVIEKFKAGKIPILLATDVIGRGIDFPNVSYIFNYDTPKSIDDYVHRIGRTGRCGNTGKSYSFINESSRPIINDLYNLLKKQNKEIPDFIERMYRKSKGNYQYRPTSYKNNYQGHNRQQNRYSNTNSGSEYKMVHEKMSWRNK